MNSQQAVTYELTPWLEPQRRSTIAITRVIPRILGGMELPRPSAPLVKRCALASRSDAMAHPATFQLNTT